MIPTDEILEALDLSRARPGIGFLEALFARFNARVPFESATKILRHAAVADVARKPRRPEVFWQEHLEAGTGGTCFARVAAFSALLESVGFSVRRALGHVGSDFDHAALFVEREGSVWLCDVGFPLPAIVPAHAGDYATERGSLAVRATPRGLEIRFAEGVPEGARSLEVFFAPVPEDEFEERWRATFRQERRFLAAVKLRIEAGARTVSFAQGSVSVDDLHSRLTVPLARPRAPRLSEIFGIDQEILGRALSLAGDPDPEGAGSLAAYLETAVAPEEAFAAISTAEGYRALYAGVAQVSIEEASPQAFRLLLFPPEGTAGQPNLTEEVAVDYAASRLTVVRRGAAGISRSSYRVEAREGRSYLIREAFFDSPREDLLRNDSLRGRLAGLLSVDLLAWARRLGSRKLDSGPGA